MLRIARLRTEGADPRISAWARAGREWSAFLTSRLGPDCAKALATPEVVGEEVHFLTPLSGAAHEIGPREREALSPAISAHGGQVSRIKSCLGGAVPPSLEPSREGLLSLLSGEGRLFLVGDDQVVLVPTPTRQAAVAPFPWWRWLLFLLLLGLLALALSFLRCGKGGGEAVDPAPAPSQNEAQPPEAVADGQPAPAPLRKCKILVERGEMPQLIIALDASGSMSAPLGQVTRMEAAKAAAVDLVRATDPGVPIGLMLLNDCPHARFAGLFDAPRRPDLITAIEAQSAKGGTPLVDALRQIGDIVDGVKSDAVVILISDGYDACEMPAYLEKVVDPRLHCALAPRPPLVKPGTCSVYEVGGTCEERPGDQECIVNMSFYSRPDVCVHISDPASCQEISRIRGRHCTLAAELHRQKPRLRIHTILIGEGLGQLSCISSATGGSVQEPRDAAELVKGLLEAGTSLREICEE